MSPGARIAINLFLPSTVAGAGLGLLISIQEGSPTALLYAMPVAFVLGLFLTVPHAVLMEVGHTREWINPANLIPAYTLSGAALTALSIVILHLMSSGGAHLADCLGGVICGALIGAVCGAITGWVIRANSAGPTA